VRIEHKLAILAGAANSERRNNPVLHQRQLPRRYWQYLPLKSVP
jgi:hypothetical protein